jgi:DNA polymerase beta
MKVLQNKIDNLNVFLVLTSISLTCVMSSNFATVCISMIQELIQVKEDTIAYYKKLDAKAHSTDINQISFKVKNYKKWLSIISVVDEILNTIANDVQSKHMSPESIEERLNSTPELSSSSLKKKLLELLTKGELPEITESKALLASLKGEKVDLSLPTPTPTPTPTKKRSSPKKTDCVVMDSVMTPVVCEETSVKKRLANVVLTDDRSKVLFDLQRVTGIGAANAAKLAELGATLDGLLDEWKSLIKADPNNGIIMMDKVLPIPANATSSEIIRINRERARLLSVKFENTRFIKQLTHHQLVGIKYFDQIEKRIPRAEIQEIERFLKEIASRMSPDFIITICGSYRRGKDSSGDVDVFLTHKEFRTKEDASKFTTKGNKGVTCNLLTEFVRIATAVNFIVDHLTEDGETKYMGMCKLKDHTIAHRIDIRLIAFNSYGPAILYFTGSFNFNQQMRNHALTKGYTLNEYGLFKCTRDSVTKKIVKGDLIPVESEEEIFKIIDYPYKTPQERDI